ncbi:MAG TPA: hypothetical protein VGW38_25460 [Chloroflexota bacterium]|nr:hypothetical protein [Chloroflexota bacterium]
MANTGRYKRLPEGHETQSFELHTPAGYGIHLTVSKHDPNTITAAFRNQDTVHRHTAPEPEQHREAIPTLYHLARQPGTAARFVSDTVMVLFDITREGYGYLWDIALPERSHWGYVRRERP